MDVIISFCIGCMLGFLIGVILGIGCDSDE